MGFFVVCLCVILTEVSFGLLFNLLTALALNKTLFFKNKCSYYVIFYEYYREIEIVQHRSIWDFLLNYYTLVRDNMIS